MKRLIRIIIIIFSMLLLMGCVGYKIICGPSVSIKEKREITEYVENYLTIKYGEHDFKVTSIKYEYDMETLFDYSNPIGYWVYFKSKPVDNSWIKINGINSNDYEVDNDYFIEDYYFPDMDGYDVMNKMNDIEPKEELETIILNEIKNEFEPNAYEVKCDTINLEISEDYGRIPTLEELKTDSSLYKTSTFEYKLSSPIEDTDKYKEKLKLYIKDKYNCDSIICFYKENTIVSVFIHN